LYLSLAAAHVYRMVSGRASGIGPASFFSFPRDVDEMVLAHVIENNVEAAYRRGDLVKMRAKMMESWAAFLARDDYSKQIVPFSAMQSLL